MITVGKITSAHGIKGEVKVLSLSDNPERFKKDRCLQVEGQSALYRIDAARVHKGDTLIIKFAGIDDRNEAESLKGSVLQIDESEIGTLPPHHFYRFQLEGLEVLDEEGKRLGYIDAVLESGANDIYRVCREDGECFLLPALKQVVKDVDLETGTMTVTLLPGLLEACSYHED